MTEDPTLQLGAEPQTAGEIPATASWGGFSLLARVGAGGFGEVYRAWDPSLQREVALKLLLPARNSSAADREAEFQATLREARALAAVRHPNIVSIYGCDRHDGRVGFWTDFVRGKTLASLLAIQGPFGYREAALIGLEVTTALAAVHRANLLHRDIKPENVMREEGGRILLMDFGLSTLPAYSVEHLSQLSGTPNYMAPELFRHQPASVASDLYAVGVLLYFLVTGATPRKLSGLTLREAAEASMVRKPLIDVRSDLPEPFLRVINRALDLDPARRCQSAGEMAEALAASIGASAAVPPPALPAAGSAAPAVPVEREKHDFAWWRKYIVTAIVLLFVFGNRIPIVNRLFDHKTEPAGAAVASDTDAPGASDLYEQAQALLLKSYKYANIDAAIAKFSQIPADDPHYPLALAGLGSAHFIQYRNSGDAKLLDLAVTETRHANQLAPKIAPPYVTLARIAVAGGHNAEAMQLANKAIQIDQTNADAYRALADALKASGDMKGAVETMQHAADLAPEDWRFPMNLGLYYNASGDLEKAAEEYEKSAELAGDNPLVYFDLGHVDMQLNKLDEAQANIEHSLQIDPQARTYEELSWLDIERGRLSEARTAAQQAVTMEASSYVAWSTLADADWLVPALHDDAVAAYRKAITLAEEIHRREPKDAELLAALANFYAHVGERDRSRSLIQQAILLAPGNPRVAYIAGQSYEMMGDRANAILLIKQCIGRGYSLAEVERNPELTALRADPSFQVSLRKQTTAAPEK